MRLPLRALLAAALSFPTLPATAAERTPQYVLISFDGARDNALWQRSRALAARTGARFTYFLSCVFLLSPETRGEYRAPGAGKSRSNVGFGSSTEDVAERLRHIWAANGEGHEIASHGCGHFDGKDWGKQAWQAEFEAFSRVLKDAWRINGLDEGEPKGWQAFAEGVAGFRAPYLSTGSGLEKALGDSELSYDASTVSRAPEKPAKSDGVVRFALPLIPEGPSSRPVLAMDYNLYVRHSGGLERPDEADRFEERAYEAFKAAFEAQYRGERVPLQLGFHFTLMNDGAYWRALERLAEEICIKADVECVSYRDYLDIMRRGAG